MFETFEHKADIGIRGFGKTIAESYEETAKAMFSIMFDLDNIEKKETIEIKCEADDNELLLIEWLNHLLAEASVNEMVFVEFEVKIDGKTLTGKAIGENLDLKKHKPKIEIKAATYSNLKVFQENNKWVSQCIVDV